MLGFGPCHHMYEVRKSQQQVDRWHEVALGQTPNWERLFEGYASQVDWPASVYWKDLCAQFPNAKVILTDRDPEAWYESISRTILPASEIGRLHDPDPLNRKASDMMYHIVLQGIFEGRLADRDFAIKRMKDHRQEVIDTVDPDRLLVFRAGQNWKPLCEFLDVPILEEQFPNGNSVADFLARKPYLAGCTLER